MCTSETVVCYGIVMRSWQLIVAAKAFAKFSPQLRGIDIIISRHRNGTLRVMEKVRGIRSISDMPLEVLDMIRAKVFREKSMKIAAKKLAQAEEFDSSAGWRKIPKPHGGWWGCGCWDRHYDALYGVNLQAPSIRNAVVSEPCHVVEVQQLTVGHSDYAAGILRTRTGFSRNGKSSRLRD